MRCLIYILLLLITKCFHFIFVYSKGLIYLHIPIEDNDYLSVPTLEGFVMNRVLGDYLENLMYKIFVSIDEHTCVSEVISKSAFYFRFFFFFLIHSVKFFCGGFGFLTVQI